MKMQHALWLLSAALFLSGCVVNAPAKPDDPYYAPVLAPTPAATAQTNGSLYQANTSRELFIDSKAGRVGDILTVVLEENTVSRKSSNVDVNKNSEVSIPGGASARVLGNPVSFKGLSLDTNLSAEREFNGEADAAQSNNLIGDVTVSVVDVWPNGTMVIRGEKWLTLNRGDEYIRVSGLVRPDDVRPDNTVLSTKVANARITYAGTGALADSQTMGWMSRFFNSGYWPF
jgi:flagellar L-ring protein precursor FlgH